MSTYDMLKKLIELNKKRGSLNDKFIASTKNKMDVFLMNERITEEEYNQLIKMMDE